jgi:hypothetical protein
MITVYTENHSYFSPDIIRVAKPKLAEGVGLEVRIEETKNAY